MQEAFAKSLEERLVGEPVQILLATNPSDDDSSDHQARTHVRQYALALVCDRLIRFEAYRFGAGEDVQALVLCENVG